MNFGGFSLFIFTVEDLGARWSTSFVAPEQHSGASVWSRNGSRVTLWVRWANVMRGVFSGK